jgi:hypothetical protein
MCLQEQAIDAIQALPLQMVLVSKNIKQQNMPLKQHDLKVTDMLTCNKKLHQLPNNARAQLEHNKFTYKCN